MENVPRDESGSASSIMSFIMYFGSDLGTAMFAAFFQIGVGTGSLELSQMTLAHFLDGFHFAMIMGVAISLMALVLASVKEKKRPRHVKEIAPEGA